MTNQQAVRVWAVQGQFSGSIKCTQKFYNELCLSAVKFVKICNIYANQMLIKMATSIIISDKL